MSEPVRELDAAIASVADRWDGARTERTLEELHRKRRQRRTRAVWGTGVGVAAVGALAVAFSVSRGTSTSDSAASQRSVSGPQAPHVPEVQSAGAQPFPSQLSAADDALHLQLADGSEVWLHDARAQVRVDEVTPARVALELQAGQARFDVQHREDRRFRVRSGSVTVEVLGTAFELQREAARTRVIVLRGRVGVEWPGGRTELAAGEAGWFPRTDDARSRSGTARRGARAAAPPPASEAGSLQPAAAHPNGKVSGRKPAALPSAKTWRDPAEQGDFDHAYELLLGSAHPVADDVEELLLAADTARLSGHPDAALPFLRRVIERHSGDSRAPLAAFTLGGVLMQQLGEPREAEAAYARARELSLNASLAEDALARQVEAAHRAGDATRARQLAREYLDQYPSGRRVHAVQRFGGLEH